MGWVSPITNQNTLNSYSNCLKEIGELYYTVFEIGIHTGLSLLDILKLKVNDIKNKDEITIKDKKSASSTTYYIPKNIKEMISEYTKNKKANDFIFESPKKRGTFISREYVYRAFKMAGKKIGLNSFGSQTMRKTFAWNYYQKTHDIHYLQHIFHQSSPSTTYRFIGVKAVSDIHLAKLTPEENQNSRRELCQNDEGKKRIDYLIRELETLKEKISDPMNPDVFYGTLDCLLFELEDLLKSFHETLD